MPLVSVIIPCFNGAAFIERAARSALEQDVSTEVILVDDGSTDDSARRAQEVMRANPDRVHVILQPNQGPAAARNAGLRLARGQFICFLDVDDEMARGFLEPALRLFDPGPSVVAVQGRVVLIDLHRKVEPWQQEVMESTMPGNLLMRTETARQIGGFPVDPRFRGQVAGEDGTFRTELARFGQVLKLDLPFIRHRLRPGGHADLFLDRAVFQGGRVAFKYLLPEERDGTLNQAIADYRRQVADRMIERLVENLKTQISGVDAFQLPYETMRHFPSVLHPAEGFALYALARTWPARGGIVKLGADAPAALGWLAAGCRDSKRGSVAWVVPPDAAPDQNPLRESRLLPFVQIAPLNDQPWREPIRLLVITPDGLSKSTPPPLDPWLASLAKDGLFAVLGNSSSKEFVPLRAALSDGNRWQQALSVQMLTVFRKLPT
jgi:glycosyltransferase involved in cell wall biosynthesis